MSRALLLGMLSVAFLAGCKSESVMYVNHASFGTADDLPVELYTLTNKNGMRMKVANYGCIITSLTAPDAHGKFEDVVLGFDDLESYLKGHPYFGAVAGRVANRIAKGQFTLDGKSYQLATNNGANHLHGGKKGFDKQVWKAQAGESNVGPYLKLTRLSPEGEEGYPGNLTATVIYTLTHTNELRIEFLATTDRATPVNLANHSYWNLAGCTQGDIRSHELKLEAGKYTPVDDGLIPTGELAPVKGTPFDFTQFKLIGQDIEKLANKEGTGGYDHNFCLDAGRGALHLAATLRDPVSGRQMEVWTSEPGVQFYTGNFLNGSIIGKGGAVYNKHAALCLETQTYPNAVNTPSFPNSVLKPGQVYRQVTIHKFTSYGEPAAPPAPAPEPKAEVKPEPKIEPKTEPKAETKPAEPAPTPAPAPTVETPAAPQAPAAPQTPATPAPKRRFADPDGVGAPDSSSSTPAALTPAPAAESAPATTTVVTEPAPAPAPASPAAVEPPPAAPSNPDVPPAPPAEPDQPRKQRRFADPDSSAAAA